MGVVFSKIPRFCLSLPVRPFNFENPPEMDNPDPCCNTILFLEGCLLAKRSCRFVANEFFTKEKSFKILKNMCLILVKTTGFVYVLSSDYLQSITCIKFKKKRKPRSAKAEIAAEFPSSFQSFLLQKW